MEKKRCNERMKGVKSRGGKRRRGNKQEEKVREVLGVG